MCTSKYLFKTKIINNRKVIDFGNYSRDFIEVVFVIDDKDAKTGKAITKEARGYVYPPSFHKAIMATKDGQSLPFSKRGFVRAFVYYGKGKYRRQDKNLPSFLRYKYLDKVIFKRTSQKPIDILEIRYKQALA